MGLMELSADWMVSRSTLVRGVPQALILPPRPILHALSLSAPMAICC
jgi:hypothetical protein